jgi:hypothetical protein
VDAPNRLLEAAQEIQHFCRSRNWRFCFIGGIAVQRWGEARLTRDADLTVYTGIGDEFRYIEELLGAFKVFANRPQDWLDVEGIIVKSGHLINWEEVRADLAVLLELKDDTTALGRLDELLARLSTP